MSSYQSEVLAAVEKGNDEFRRFKEKNDARFAELEAKFEDVENKAARASRPGFGMPTQSGAVKTETKAWSDAFIRKGQMPAQGPEEKALAWSTNSGADGGYAVPKLIDQRVDAVAVQQGAMLGLVRTVDSFTSDFHEIVQTTRNANAWVGETAARPATNTGGFVDIKPPMGELYANPQITQQLLDDAGFDIENYVVTRVGEEFGAAIETGILTGNGVNQPTGILSGTFAATDDSTRAFGQLQYLPTGVAGDWAATNKADILLQLVYKLKAAYRKTACWLMHPQVMQEILSFKDSQGRYLIQTGLVQGEPPTLLGYPIFESEMMPIKAANSLSALFGDFKRAYVFVNRTPTRMVRDPLTNKPYVGFYTTRRVAGAVTNSEAVKALKFSAS